MLHVRGIEGVRVLQGILSLTKQHSSEALEKACKSALSHGCFRLRTLRALLKRSADAEQQSLPFLNEHPIIRPMSDYAAVIHRAIHREDSRSSVSEGFLRHGGTKASVAGVPQKSPAASRETQSGTTDLLPPRCVGPLPGCTPQSLAPFHRTILV